MSTSIDRPPRRNSRRPGSKGRQAARTVQHIEEILVPVDFSAASRQALRAAIQWARRFAARLHLLYVIEPPTVPQWGYAFLALRESRLRKEAERQLNSLRQTVP